MFKKLAIVLIGFYLCIGSIQAEPLNYNIINFSAIASEEVKQDLLVATLMVRTSGTDRQEVSNQATELSNNLLEKLRSDKRLVTKLDRRNTYQQDSKMNSQWSDTIYISVKSQDFKALNAMLAKVQKESAISNLSYTISAKKRADVKEKLIDVAIKKFNKKAQLIAKSLGKSHFKIIKLNFDETEQGHYGHRIALESKSASGLVMSFEPGTELINLSITGSVQLQ